MNNKEDLKFCINCKHYISNLYDPQCKRFPPNVDVVKGHIKNVTKPCEDERSGIMPWKCGKKARFFEEKR